MQTLTILPIEVAELVKQVSDVKQTEVQEVLQQIFTGTAEWQQQVDSIDVKGIEDKMSITLAETARKNIKDARLKAEKLFDTKRQQVQVLKAEFDMEDKLWLKAKQVMQIKFKAIEEVAEWKANFVKRFEAEQKELRTQKRINEVVKYAPQMNRSEFDLMSDASFDAFLSGIKSAYKAKIEAEAKAEVERIAKEKAEAEAREQQRIENEKLKAEAEAREKEMAAERAAAAEKLASETAKAKAENDRIKAEAEAELKAQREATAKIEAELKAKREAEAKAAAEAKVAEAKAAAEAKKLAAAPIKKQLLAWVDSFLIPETNIESEKVAMIKSKFEAFKAWANQEANTL